MVSCSVLGCRNRHERAMKDVSFHRFPKNNQAYRKWILACGRDNWTPSASARICSVRFEKRFYIGSSNKLRLFSYPTKFIHGSSTTETTILDTSCDFTDTIIIEDPCATLPTRLDPSCHTINGPNIDDSSSHLVADAQNGRKRGRKDEGLEDTPRKKRLRKQLERKSKLAELRLKKLRAVRQSKRRLVKKIADLRNVITELKTKCMISCEDADFLSTLDPVNQDLLKRLTGVESKNQKYSPSLRKFALCLHFISPSAYMHVRQQFDTCLPHPQTLRNWYRIVDGDPGFTDESFKALKNKTKDSKHNIFVSVTFDEMTLHKDTDYDGFNSLGVVNIGSNTEGKNARLAKQVLVFMVTAINDSWKIPVGYFVIDGVSAEQKGELLKTCLSLLFDSNVEVVSVTCDGCPTNFSMARYLGCDLDNAEIKPYFSVTVGDVEKIICFFPDPPHMFKLVRNTLADKLVLKNKNNEDIFWSYITNLHELQEEEGLRFRNKLTRAHIYFKKQIMKVKLAAQTFSMSVANAIEYCREKFGVFSGSSSTVEFIRLFNNLFDVLNSRNINAYGFKKPLNQDNFVAVNVFLNDMYEYISNLKLNDGTNILNSNRHKGFLGFLCCIRSIQCLYKTVVLSSGLIFLPAYKLSQDHIECFFSAVRAKGGFNNNPTAIQFKAAYKRLIVHGELKHISSGNCTPLENISILTYSNSRYEKVINSTLTKLTNSDVTETSPEDNSLSLDSDHDYLCDPARLTEYSKEVISYIAGFVTTKISKIIKCENCLLILISHEKYEGIISKYDKGGLHYPSKDVVFICEMSEKIFRRKLAIMGSGIFTLKNGIVLLVNECLSNCQGIDLFINHGCPFDQSPLDNHIILLIKAVAFKYLQVRFYYMAKKTSEPSEKVRNFYTKLMLFKNQ